MSHKAQAIVLSCIDFRFRKDLQNFLEEDLKLNEFDHKTDGGSVKQLITEGPVSDWILANFEIAFDLHGVQRIILINHQDCGAYGGSKKFTSFDDELTFQRDQLNQAVSFLSEKYPDKIIEAYFAQLSEPINFEKIV
ncbi:MAG: hypothetical protein Q8P83_01345 [bacterium]|nr:hypothetical protein [bacterium]